MSKITSIAGVFAALAVPAFAQAAPDGKHSRTASHTTYAPETGESCFAAAPIPQNMKEATVLIRTPFASGTGFVVANSDAGQQGNRIVTGKHVVSPSAYDPSYKKPVTISDSAGNTIGTAEAVVLGKWPFGHNKIPTEINYQFGHEDAAVFEIKEFSSLEMEIRYRRIAGMKISSMQYAGTFDFTPQKGFISPGPGSSGGPAANENGEIIGIVHSAAEVEGRRMTLSSYGNILKRVTEQIPFRREHISLPFQENVTLTPLVEKDILDALGAAGRQVLRLSNQLSQTGTITGFPEGYCTFYKGRMTPRTETMAPK